ncbi:hypothetical protein Pst134EA_006921 [Puccinia striiformis f. sp. tritici]|uniref:hypothetical protein n=1 Tax=Puccinia striiformis f. sp. tritici TaxID=168172 RepID=UPI002008D5A7|nr:hypothetical protein Pst134EA_006921 [Puccinia striiformis f. sp. tritici]KAH9469633.1 hypothetical protein Pst134EA_006921 [Puccinia striiformis f. sp. tritici]
MFRRSRIPLNSTDPSILQEVLERQSSTSVQLLQPSPPLKDPYSNLANSFRFMTSPGGQSILNRGLEEPLLVKPQPRLKSLIKLEHLLRPSPSFRLAGPRRVASAPSPVVHRPMALDHQTHHEPQRKRLSTGWLTHSTPRNPIVTINGLKTQFSVQVSDGESYSHDDDDDESSTSQSSSVSKSSPGYSRPNSITYSSTPSSSCASFTSSSSLAPSCVSSSGDNDHNLKTSPKVSNLNENRTDQEVNDQPPVKLNHQTPARPHQASPIMNSHSVPREEISYNYKRFHSPENHRVLSSLHHQPLNLSTDSHPRRRPLRRRAQDQVDEADLSESSSNNMKGKTAELATSLTKDVDPQGVDLNPREEMPIRSALHLPSSPRKQTIRRHESARDPMQKNDLHTLAPLKTASGRPQSLKKAPISPQGSLGGGEVAKADHATDNKVVDIRDSCKRAQLETEDDQPINTNGLSAFIRPIKYGILQLSSASSSTNPAHSNSSSIQKDLGGGLHVRLWIKDQNLLAPIPANLIVISPNGGQIELFHTDILDQTQETDVTELNRSYKKGDLRVIFYSLKALPDQIRMIYKYLNKFLGIMLGGIPRAVFQLHTPKFQQRVRCAIMMNGPTSDIELEFLTELKLKIKLSRNRCRVKIWLFDQFVHLQELSDIDLTDINLSLYLVKLIRQTSSFHQPLNHQIPSDHRSTSLHHRSNRFQDLLDFIHPCLYISHQIEKSLNLDLSL